ncbi:low choriolytic enzyme-like [Cottoperca gobio]|uniref:Metalloendopeptidase n=1 Tax=Cottoperca gobio TaxID=56716 RepID=A0A6J2SA14_COTGO|nr:low choriolytic enzyme-like [Cottoperca gobio]
MVSLLLMLLLGLCNAQEDHGPDNETSEGHSDEDISTTILRMNNGSTDFLLEGDMIIPTTRNAMKCYSQKYSCLWPKSANGKVEIPFIIKSSYTNNERSTILRAMRDIESKTCIRYIPYTSQRGYLTIEPRFGCATIFGYVGSKQVLSLMKNGCVVHGIVQHELLHVLGFHHEHNRSDRDQYIRINWENIQDHAISNFQKRDTNNLDTRYDYSSVTHYGRTSFGKQSAETITPIPDSSTVIGQRKGLSKTDIVKINRLYKCRR